MIWKTASGLKSALVITATLIAPALASSSVAIADIQPVVQNVDTGAVVAAQNLLQTMKFKTILEPIFEGMAERMKLAAATDPTLRNSPLDVRQLALQLCHQRVDDLVTDIAKYYATRFAADELREASAFYDSEAGMLFSEFNREQLTKPTTRESASAEFVKRFTDEQRGQIVRYLTSAVGQKFLHFQPELKQKLVEIAGEWGLKIGLDVEHAIRSGRSATLTRATWSPTSGTNHNSTVAL
jgi:hypothetical protein